MRMITTVFLLSTLSLGSPCLLAAHVDDAVPDPSALAALQAKANDAQPRDRCYLYAQLVDEMTELAGHQFDTGESGKGSATLKLIQHYAEMLRTGIAEDSKKLKNAELLMQHTSFRLRDILQSASYEDRPPLEATLKQLDQVQSQLMMQMFKK